MKTLTLLRHAKSSWENSDLNDMDRPLTNRGYADAFRISHLLKSTHYIPDRILSSTALRAKLTASFFSQILSDPSQISFHPTLYFEPIKKVKAFISSQPNTPDHIMIVSHNPMLEELIKDLTGTECGKFPTCAHITFRFDTTEWNTLFHHTPECIYFGSPKQNFRI